MKDRYRVMDIWLGTIERAIERGDGEAASTLTRQYVQRCRELGVLGPTQRAPREDLPPYERPNDGEIPQTLPTVAPRWQRRGGWGS